MENQNINFTVPVELHREFRRACFDADRAMAKVLRDLIKEYVQKRKKS